MSIGSREREIVRDLARKVAEIAADPINDTKREMWRRLNGLDMVRPMVFINELPFWELKCDELTPVCEDKTAKSIEESLRWTIYLWNNVRADMVVDPVYHTPFIYEDTGFGVEGERTDSEGGDYGFGSHDYIPIMKTDADIERIQLPKVTADWEATDRLHSEVSELIGDVIPVEKQGVTHMWGAPWDILVQWWGITELMTDMVDRPEFVNRGISRMMDALISRLDQLEEQGLLSVGNCNHRVGSGGLGITDQLPQADFDGTHVRTMDQWGTSTGQIFSEVSPAMHDEFCLQHEMRWLERFGLNCYGCCEPLHNKMGILKKVPNLRRISMSTWVDIDKGAAELGADYIYSSKPNPAVFAWDQWNPEQAREDLVTVLDRTKGCQVELIMKDVSTCRSDPKRLTDWCEIAVRTAEEYAV
jgi:hypothetical protein